MDIDIYEGKLWEHIRLLKTEITKALAQIHQSVGLSEFHAFVIMEIKTGDSFMVSKLAERLNTNQGNFSVACKKMEQMGLVIRKRSSEDERIVTLELTEMGEEKANHIDKELVKLLRKANLTKNQIEKIAAGYAEAVKLLKTINKSKQEPQCNGLCLLAGRLDANK